MAKDSDKRAGSLKKPDTGGGALTGFLAEEEHLDRRALLRLGTWGVASVSAVIIAVLANQSSMKLRHDEVAAMDIARQSQQIQSIAKESQNETRRLASAIDTLDSDRDRLYARVTVLEQGLDSVTGSIARQSAAASSLVATPAPPHSPSPSPQPVAQSPAPAPVTAPVATAAPAAAPEKPLANAKPPEPAATTVASATPPAPANALQAATSGITPAPQPAPVPLMASKSMIGPPDPAASKPVEPKPAEPQAPAKAAVATPAPVPAPIVVASAPPDEKKTTEAAKETVKETAKETAKKASDAALPQIAVKRTEFGVDVGGANSVGGLRALWRGLLKSRSNAPLAALQPIIMIKEGNNGLGMQLRLVAGPLSDAATAARICAAIAEHERPCETTVFDGQRLAMTGEDASASAEDGSAKSDSSKSESIKPDTDKPAAAKPVSGRQYYYHHRSYPKKPAPVAEAPPPPPKPEPTTLSSFFSRRQP
jgi:hypothetical protein